MRCRKHCENRHQQFSPAFETGDDIAIPALKDVLISLQGEVIQALHIARAVENAILDFTTLHETSVTNRKDATRAMDQLCQRIMASMQYGLHKSEARNPSDSSMRSSFASMPLSSYDLPPSPPASVGSPRQPDNQRAFSQRTLTIRPPIDKVDHRGHYNASQASPLGWISSQANHSSSDLIAGNTPSSTTGKEQSDQSPDDLELKQRSQVSIQRSALGSYRGSEHLQPASTALTITPRYPQHPSNRSQATSEHPPQHLQQGTASTDSATILASGTHRKNNGGSLGDTAEALSTWSRTTKPSPQRPSRIETEDHLQPAFDAPEVVSADVEGIHAMPEESSEKCPAFLTQSDYAERLLSLPAGMDSIWMPLKRPAMHNRYHGFCKGAWQIRKAVRSRN